MDNRLILLVDDDIKMQRLLQSQLALRGYQVEGVLDGQEALRRAAEQPFDLVLLDIKLPGMDGLEVCRQLRSWSSVAIILLTGSDKPQLKMTALEQGADDYVTKPFHMGELVARIGAVIRRTRTEKAPLAIVEIDDLVIDFIQREACRDGKPIHLTRIEFNLLHEFVRHADRLLTYEQLMLAVWGSESEDVRTLHVHVSHLRRKLQPNPTAPRRIITLPGIGYRFRLHGW